MFLKHCKVPPQLLFPRFFCRQTGFFGGRYIFMLCPNSLEFFLILLWRGRDKPNLMLFASKGSRRVFFFFRPPLTAILLQKTLSKDESLRLIFVWLCSFTFVIRTKSSLKTAVNYVKRARGKKREE